MTPDADDLKATRLPLLGGNVCLDFTNTAEYRGSEAFIELVPTFERLLAWCRHAALLGEAEHERLLGAAARHRAQADGALQSALALREAMHRVFAGLARGQAPTTATLKPLNQTWQQLAAQRQLVPATGGDGGATWAWSTARGVALDPVLGPLLQAAGDLLASEQVRSLRECPGCGWLFLDTSRNHMRRWCSMAWCGSKMKSRRQYARRKDSERVSGSGPS